MPAEHLGLSPVAQSIYTNGLQEADIDRITPWINRRRLLRYPNGIVMRDSIDTEIKQAVDAVVIRWVWDRLMAEQITPNGLMVDVRRLTVLSKLTGNYHIKPNQDDEESVSHQEMVPLPPLAKEAAPLGLLGFAWIDMWNNALDREITQRELELEEVTSGLDEQDRKRMNREETWPRIFNADIRRFEGQKDVQTYDVYKKMLAWFGRYNTEKIAFTPQARIGAGVMTAVIFMEAFFRQIPQLVKDEVGGDDPDLAAAVLENSFGSLFKLATNDLGFHTIIQDDYIKKQNLPLTLVTKEDGTMYADIPESRLAEYDEEYEKQAGKPGVRRGVGCPAGAIFSRENKSIIHNMWKLTLPVVQQLYRDRFEQFN